MDLWYTDKHTPGRGLTLKVNNILHQEKSAFQEMTVLDTDDFGLVMLLDGVIMVTQADEFVYHEMITHPALYAHPNPRNVLIIGGGDGGTLREVLAHKSVQEAVLCEIDGMVIDGAKRFFPALATGFNDPRAQVVVADGIEYVKNQAGRFDVILIDSTDPVGPATGLFLADFFALCRTALKPGGILVTQCESPYITALRPVISGVMRDLGNLFPVSALYLAAVQTYQAGLWSFALGSLGPDPRTSFNQAAFTTDNHIFKYYNPGIHHSCFVLPNCVASLLQE